MRIIFFTMVVLLNLSHCIAAPVSEKFPQLIENTLGMKFVLLPAGEFMMGSEESADAHARDFPLLERKRFLELADEAPLHRVRISRRFYLGQHEVTVGQFRRFIEASGYRPEAEADGTGGYGYNRDYATENSIGGEAWNLDLSGVRCYATRPVRS